MPSIQTSEPSGHWSRTLKHNHLAMGQGQHPRFFFFKEGDEAIFLVDETALSEKEEQICMREGVQPKFEDFEKESHGGI